MDRESGGPQSMELQRVGYDCSDLACMHTWTAAHQASLSFIISRSLLKLMSIELMMPSNHLVAYWKYIDLIKTTTKSLAFAYIVYACVSGKFG